MSHLNLPPLLALAHSALGTMRVNSLLETIREEKNLSLEEFFALPEKAWREEFAVTEREIPLLRQAKADIPNCSFLAEDLLDQGFEITPVWSPEYSMALRENLKSAAPPVLYSKGNKKLLNEDTIAILGSRDPSALSLQFAENVVKRVSEQSTVIVSGFAKGVDKQALEAGMKYRGHTIIVLPQGVMTFDSGIRKYYRQIVDGGLLVLSPFHPKAPWSAGLALARNSIIEGLAGKLYVAEARPEGNTWSAVIDKLGKGQTIFVRMPEESEKNANEMLIAKGALTVGLDGNPLPPILSLKQPEIQPAPDAPPPAPVPAKKKSPKPKKKKSRPTDDAQMNLL